MAVTGRQGEASNIVTDPDPDPPGCAMALLLELLSALARDSQRGACRNALVASTALAERSRERQDVEEFLARQVPAPPRVPGQRVG